MADVRKVMDFETPTQFEAMGRDLRILSTRLPVTAEGLGEIAAAAGQAGIAHHELLRFTEDAAKVGVAFDLGAREAGSAMTGLRSIFKLNQDQLMDLAGAYNHLSNNMDATAADMLRVANRSGSTAQEMFGLTGQQVGALGAAFLALKTPPEVAGTAINAMLTKLATADQQGARFQDALYEIGMSAEDLREAIERDGQGALLDFLEVLDQADDKQSVLFNLFGQEYVDDIAKLTGGLDLYRQAIGLSSSEAADAGSVLDEYATRAATTGNALTLLRNRFARLGGAIGDAFLPALKDGTGWLGRAIDKASELAERFPAVTRAVAGLAAGLVAAKAAAGSSPLARGTLPPVTPNYPIRSGSSPLARGTLPRLGRPGRLNVGEPARHSMALRRPRGSKQLGGDDREGGEGGSRLDADDPSQSVDPAAHARDVRLRGELVTVGDGGITQCFGVRFGLPAFDSGRFELAGWLRAG